MVIKSFRGRMNDSEVDTISLHTIDGSIGYRIVKFQIMGVSENQTSEATMKIFKTPQPDPTVTPPTTSVDFSDNTMLAAALYGDSSATPGNAEATIIFDKEIFNQDIYITYKDGFAQRMNYYIELEQVKLDLNENTVATLKDIRNIEAQSLST